MIELGDVAGALPPLRARDRPAAVSGRSGPAVRQPGRLAPTMMVELRDEHRRRALTLFREIGAPAAEDLFGRC